MLIIRGVRNDLSFIDQFKLLRNANSRGVIGFTVWLLVHSIFQLVLFFLVFPIQHPGVLDEFITPDSLISMGLPLGPVEFLILAIFEVGFYLFLIIYQLVQLEKCKVVFQPINVQTQEEIEPRIPD